MSTEITKAAVFKGRHVRRILVKDEWWFSVVDVCSVLTDSPDPGAYWRKLKQRLKEEGSQVVTFCHELKLEASDGKKYRTDCANTEGIFRITMLGEAATTRITGDRDSQGVQDRKSTRLNSSHSS